MMIYAIIALVVIGWIVWRMSASGIRVEKLKSMLNDRDKVFIDVRTPGEFKSGHIQQFKNVPLGSDFSKLPKEKEIVVICQRGMRSVKACKQLKQMGYKNVTNVRGGMTAWQNEQ